MLKLKLMMKQGLVGAAIIRTQGLNFSVSALEIGFEIENRPLSKSEESTGTIHRNIEQVQK